ncbi:capsule biosynthesis protein [Sphingomonas faeni]|uniref:capsule biosynthesis protein n=1 Tax=Sphingomonas faeni TaxID=185950 RepID=UPI00334FB5EC
MSAASSSSTRCFLFLQGPHGPYFARLGGALAARGHPVFRINLNGGDRRDWPGVATQYHGTLHNWPTFFDDFVVSRDITDIVLFGDCRPHHSSAHGMAKLRGLRVHVVEEGYIRPDFVTLEEGGVNGHSSLPRDPIWYRAEAARLPAVAPFVSVPSSFKRRARETVRHLVATALLYPLYPFYQNHRPESAWLEALGWLMRSIVRGRERRQCARVWAAVKEHPYFIVPLQLNSDYQIRVHSPFNDMHAALRFIIKSFAQAAPADVHLLVKRHPLDPGLVGWGRYTHALARRYGVQDRVSYLPDGDIGEMIDGARGAVMVNSTVGTLALNSGVPVAVLGAAVYDVEGVAHRGALEAFWNAPPAPDAALWQAVRRVLIDRCLIRGGFLSEEGLAMLVDNAIPRLIEAPKLPASNVMQVAHWR